MAEYQQAIDIGRQLGAEREPADATSRTGLGDVLLARLGQALRGALSGRGQAYRIGGDEFCVLARIGIVTPRFLIRNFRWAILIIFIVAAVLTPTPDMVTQTVFAAPMVVLYLISIVLAFFASPRRRKKEVSE